MSCVMSEGQMYSVSMAGSHTCTVRRSQVTRDELSCTWVEESQVMRSRDVSDLNPPDSVHGDEPARLLDPLLLLQLKQSPIRAKLQFRKRPLIGPQLHFINKFNNFLKDSVARFSTPFFDKKKLHLGTIWTWAFFVFAKIFAKLLKRTCVHVVVDYADTVSAWSLTTQTPCPHGQWLHGKLFYFGKRKN